MRPGWIGIPVHTGRPHADKVDVELLILGNVYASTFPRLYPQFGVVLDEVDLRSLIWKVFDVGLTRQGDQLLEEKFL
jgi:hypothetical protein